MGSIPRELNTDQSKERERSRDTPSQPPADFTTNEQREEKLSGWKIKLTAKIEPVTIAEPRLGFVLRREEAAGFVCSKDSARWRDRKDVGVGRWLFGARQWSFSRRWQAARVLQCGEVGDVWCELRAAGGGGRPPNPTLPSSYTHATSSDFEFIISAAPENSPPNPTHSHGSATLNIQAIFVFALLILWDKGEFPAFYVDGFHSNPFSRSFHLKTTVLWRTYLAMDGRRKGFQTKDLSWVNA
ncbi:DNA topoisomerase 4 subunit A [Striga asiatica]|uniref:DNA topoisomerase 4 subunit A n=1 Tax=Striga asiatica TaxID=4170 RepID=A0A5A7R9C7_STRAF|nr:DNA topoisomerase 4 subunit A [Striga asiatica]